MAPRTGFGHHFTESSISNRSAFNLTLYIWNHIYGFPNRVKARRYVAMGEGGGVFSMRKFESDVIKT